MSMSGTDVVVAPVTVNKENRSYGQWGPIIGGAVIATAISTTMTVFGSAIGLSMVSADFEKSSSATALAVAGAQWALWVMASATMAGGYLAGRMRQPSFDANTEERKVRRNARPTRMGDRRASDHHRRDILALQCGKDGGQRRGQRKLRGSHLDFPERRSNGDGAGQHYARQRPAAADRPGTR